MSAEDKCWISGSSGPYGNAEPKSLDFLCRAVGRYLQGAFENVSTDPGRTEDDVAKIGLDYTLRGKSRKEAARMFFETLVWLQLLCISLWTSQAFTFYWTTPIAFICMKIVVLSRNGVLQNQPLLQMSTNSKFCAAYLISQNIEVINDGWKLHK